MNLEQAKQLKKGDHVTSPRVPQYKADKNVTKRWKVTSVKTWKRNPARIEIGLKFGLYGFCKANENDLALLTKE